MKDKHSLQPHDTYGNNRRDPGSRRRCTSAVDSLANNNSDLHPRSDLDHISWPLLVRRNNKVTQMVFCISYQLACFGTSASSHVPCTLFCTFQTPERNSTSLNMVAGDDRLQG